MRRTDHAQPDPKDHKPFSTAMPPGRLRRLMLAAGVAVLFLTAAANGCEDGSEPGTGTGTEEASGGAPYSAPNSSPQEASRTPAETSEPPETSEVETSEAETSEPETSEAETSESPEPSETNEEPSEETDTEDFFSQFSSFEPVTQSGTGDSVIDLPAPQGIITASHNGSSNFALSVLDSGNAMSELPINVIGSYEGTTAYGMDELSEDAAALEIVADGDWEITVAPVTDAPEFSDSQAAQGDGVYLYTGGPATWALSHDGESNFAIVYVSDSLFGSELLVNEIGPYEGTVAVTSGPGVVIVIADGEWSLSPS
ncbi:MULTISPECIES: hypothetical protein [Glycomyces]|uniref:Uncharacterized protein n=1 Tax=Glycomyces lechevalierae TaxID=256034 RepID=A0A9X3PN66_9ACTN|nr:hypothetical protein [Glycomyces lechevalierae]MDA1387972.1 hypothetical protein [Glycomyces lechevalierae]MDR7339115.1 hypothetical protein [Glycomyces lechevalierae]